MKYIAFTKTKKITLHLLLLLFTVTTFSQIIGYDDAALVFSTENINGTSRFTAMSGAFGALGGDISAADVNPAGIVVFNNSEANITLGNTKIDTNSKFYNTTTNSSEDSFNLNQAGAVLVFDNDGNYWNKFAIGLNISISNNYDNSYLTTGVSPLTDFNEDPFLNTDNDDTNNVFYENVDSQKFSNITSGSGDRVTFSIAGQYDKSTSFGLSINTHNINYAQQIVFNESSNDGNNNTLQARLDQRLLVNGDGISLNFGVITKPVQNLRLGLAYQTPTWYNLIEEFQENTEIILSNTTSTYNVQPDFTTFEYKIRTPSKLTGSIAYVFDKKGLISLDYTYKDFNNTKLKPNSEFTVENENLANLNGTSEIRIGGEYRLKNMSLRAGFHTKENPIENSNSNKNGYSLGIGFKFSNTTKLDFSYDNTTADSTYRFLNFADAATINTKKDNITATLTFGL